MGVVAYVVKLQQVLPDFRGYAHSLRGAPPRSDGHTPTVSLSTAAATGYWLLLASVMVPVRQTLQLVNAYNAAWSDAAASANSSHEHPRPTEGLCVLADASKQNPRRLTWGRLVSAAEIFLCTCTAESIAKIFMLCCVARARWTSGQ